MPLLLSPDLRADFGQFGAAKSAPPAGPRKGPSLQAATLLDTRGCRGDTPRVLAMILISKLSTSRAPVLEASNTGNAIIVDDAAATPRHFEGD